MFQCWFNTFFVKEEECSIVQNGAGPTGPRYKYLTLSMNKHELDKANKDKQSKIYNRDFMVRFFNICLNLYSMIIIYKCNILERVLVENIIPRSVIIKNALFILLYRTLFLYLLTMLREVPKTTQCVIATND